MGKWLSTPGAEFVAWLALLAILVAVAYYVISKIRTESVQQEPGASE